MKRKKYKFGTSIEKPATAIARNQQAIASADAQSSSLFTDLLDVIGNAALSSGTDMLVKGLKGLNNNPNSDLENLNFIDNIHLTPENLANRDSMYAAYGGTVPVEVEGGESAKLPTGGLVEFEGPTHAKGGIDVDLPSGTEIFSDRISLDGMSMGERNVFRQKRLKKLSSLAGNSEGDKNTFERTKKSFEIDEENDKLIQSLYQVATDSAFKQKMAFGGKVRDWAKSLGDGVLDTLDGMTAGDLLGMFSTYRKGQAGLKNTQQHRAGQTPNINPFENFGKDSLNTLDSAIDLSDDILAQNISDIRDSSIDLRSRNRATARGVNTTRALDIATLSAENRAINQAYQASRSSTMDMLTRKSSLQADIDNRIMTGEAMRDENDRNDYDAYYTNRGRDLQGFFEGLTQIGGQFNRLKERDVQEVLLNSLSTNFDIDVKTGKITKKK